MKKSVLIAAVLACFVAGTTVAQLPPDAVQLDKVKISEKIKPAQFDPVTGKVADESLPTYTHEGVTYGQSDEGSKAKFDANPGKYHANAEQVRWELNFIHSMSAIWCPVTDEISPGGNTLWEMLDLTWESCCQFCNDTKTDEDFPAALKRLEKRAADAYKLQGVHYVEGASSPVQGAIDLGGPPPMPIADAEPEFIPAWLEGQTLAATWTGGIGKITENRCMECHRPGGAAPMALMTHGAMRKWSKNMKTHIELGTMPPWPASTSTHT